ncbi:MAG: hypothetical protein ACKVOM_11540 [Ferruginibacter sp.]
MTKHSIYIITVLILLTSESKSQIDSNTIFTKSKGKLSHPLSHYKIFPDKSSIGHANRGCFNPGITYYTSTEENVKAIFEGKIVSIFKIDSSYCIMTKYGSFYIAYSGLNEPVFKKGDYIKKNQFLGSLHDIGDDKYELELAILKGAKTYNPLIWIK